MVLNQKYVMKKVEINKESIKDFFIYEDERRQLRIGKVASLRICFDKESLLEKHFDSPLVVNFDESISKWKIIDGNHRYEAIKEKISKDPNFSIAVWLAEYKNLNRDEERLIYSKWNKGTPESATDFLKYHFVKVPLGEEMLKKLPVSIYGSNNTIPLKNFVGSYIVAKKNSFTGSYSAGGETTFKDMCSITSKDIIAMQEWYDFHKYIFGEYYKGNPFYTGTPLSVFFRIWFDNQHIPKKNYIKAINEVFTSKIHLWLNDFKSSGRQASILVYMRVLDSLRNYRKKLVWYSDKENLKRGKQK